MAADRRQLDAWIDDATPLDPSKPTEQRVADLISRMTPEENAKQLNHERRHSTCQGAGLGWMEPDTAWSLVEAADNTVSSSNRDGSDLGYSTNSYDHGCDVG